MRTLPLPVILMFTCAALQLSASLCYAFKREWWDAGIWLAAAVIGVCTVARTL